MQGRTLESFLEKNHLSQDEWEASKADWDVLQAIAKHHDERNHSLCTAAGAIADRLRTFGGVHSVRWRVKDTDHLLEKIIRKKLQPEQNPRYVDISVENYTKVVTDLIGVRALHLFKDDCILIDQAIRETWECKEVTIYTRKGDSEPTALIETGGEPKEHPKGYRSVHYIVETKPEKFLVYGEVQVRTLFEEGWSEIDHKVRYPNFSDNPNVELFLSIFNGLAGSADEMGSFVKVLAQVSEEAESARVQALSERDQALAKVSGLLYELGAVKNDQARSNELIDSLQRQIEEIRSPSSGRGLLDFANIGKIGVGLPTIGQVIKPALGLTIGFDPEMLEKINNVTRAFAERGVTHQQIKDAFPLADKDSQD